MMGRGGKEGAGRDMNRILVLVCCSEKSQGSAAMLLVSLGLSNHTTGSDAVIPFVYISELLYGYNFEGAGS